MTDRNRRPQQQVQQGSQQVATKTPASSPIVNKPTPTPTLHNTKPVTIATPTTMVVSRPIAPKPIMTTPTVTAPVSKSVAQNIQKLPPSVSIIQTPSANTSTTPQAASAASTASASQPPSNKKVIECVDLSDDEDQAAPKAKPGTTTSTASASNGLRMIPVSQLRGNNAVITPVKKAPANFNNLINQNVVRVARHPAPLPDPPRAQPNAPGTLPPKPTLKLSRLQTGKIF